MSYLIFLELKRMSSSSAGTHPESRIPNPGSSDVVLAFSGGLDTSFCVPYLQERGYRVHTVFADTGGVDAEERAFIEARAQELGVASHVTVDGGPAIWSGFVKPFVWAGEGYQGQYPLLVSDRYLIVEAALKRCDELGTKFIAHGCTGMGNDQVRFDLTIKALGDYVIIAPIREIQKEHTQTRAYEQQYLEQRGFGVRAKQKSYTINENLLGVTMSGDDLATRHRHAEQVLVDRVALLFRAHAETALFEILLFVRARLRVFLLDLADRRDDDVIAERLDRQVETHLVVTHARAAVRDEFRTQLIAALERGL